MVLRARMCLPLPSKCPLQGSLSCIRSLESLLKSKLLGPTQKVWTLRAWRGDMVPRF